MRPSTTTIVSQPTMISGTAARRTARALRSAFSSATARGSPVASSGADETLTLKSSPSRASSSRRCGEREARTSGSAGVARSPGSGMELAEEQRGLARSGLRGVGAVDHVLAGLDREVAADAAGGRLERVGRADHLAGGLHGLVALQHDR